MLQSQQYRMPIRLRFAETCEVQAQVVWLFCDMKFFSIIGVDAGSQGRFSSRWLGCKGLVLGRLAAAQHPLHRLASLFSRSQPEQCREENFGTIARDGWPGMGGQGSRQSSF
jgi:hypothetical protein